MRFHIDCALLAANVDWAEQLIKCAESCERIRLHILPLPDTSLEHSYLYLQQQASALQRYDACLLPISTANLVWVRRALSAGIPSLRVPVIGLTHQLKAAALFDLYALGLADYLRAPLCLQDLRARIHKIRTSTAQLVQEAQVGTLQYASAHDYSPIKFNTLVPVTEPLEQAADSSLDAYAQSVVFRYATEQASFKEAKGQVVARFERAYLCAVLDKHHGNIAQSARFAQKHRRAFWGLMRKHQINADEFRSSSVNSPLLSNNMGA